MSDSYPFSIWSGILSPEHRKAIGIAIWEYLWCINRVTKEIFIRDERFGIVLGGKPITSQEIAQDLGIHYETVKTNLRKLTKDEKYIRLIRTSRGMIINVRKSKKFKNYTASYFEKSYPQAPGNIDGVKKRKRFVSHENASSQGQRESENTSSIIDKTYVDITVKDNTSDGHSQAVDKYRLGTVSKTIQGIEELIVNDPSIIVEQLVRLDFLKDRELIHLWAAVVQSQDKQNPAGYLSSMLARQQFCPSDTAMDQAKKQMLKLNRF